MEVVRRAREMIRAHPQRTSPLWMIAAPVAQVSVLVYGLYSVRYMAKEGWGGLDAGGPFWAVDLTLPAVDVATMTAPLGMQGIVMPAALLGGFMMSIQKLRPGDKRDGEVALGRPTEREQVQRWAMGNLSMALEVLTIPLMVGVLTSPQAPLYYWTASMFTSLGMGAAIDRRRRRGAGAEAGLGGVLSKEAVSLLQQAAARVSTGDYDEALGYLKQARILAPRNASVHMAFGDVLSSLPGRDEVAAMHYRQVLEMARGEREGEDVERGGERDGVSSEALSQRAEFALGMLLSREDGTKREGLKLLERAASRVDDGDMFRPMAVRSLLAIAALGEDDGRRREALALARSADAGVAARLKETKRARRVKEKNG